MSHIILYLFVINVIIIIERSSKKCSTGKRLQQVENIQQVKKNVQLLVH